MQNGVLMSEAGQDVVLEAFWPEALHRAKMLLSDMNIGSFNQWRETVGNREINRLLKLMELLVTPEDNGLETKFLTEMINNQLNGADLFSCFKTCGKRIQKKGMNGDIYCIPVLYLLIRYLTDPDNKNINYASDFEHHNEQGTRLKRNFRFKPKRYAIHSVRKIER
ncbi:hypothetical protein ACSFCS_11500 [Yokenella regensburgei]